MAWEHLEVNEQGVRPGHPVSNRTPAPTSLGRDRLHTSVNTVRQMIAEGALEGYWQRRGSRMTFYLYAEDLEIYVRGKGTLDGRRRDRRNPVPVSLSDHPSAERSLKGLPIEKQDVSELRASLAALANRVSALEEDFHRALGGQAHHVAIDQRVGIDREQRRRLELEDALAALEEDEELVAEADLLNQQAYAKLRSAHRKLRASIAQARQPRTVADLPGVADDDNV